MTRLKLRLFFVIGVLFIAAVWWTQQQAHLALDHCLDGGGRWDYDNEVCEG